MSPERRAAVGRCEADWQFGRPPRPNSEGALSGAEAVPVSRCQAANLQEPS